MYWLNGTSQSALGVTDSVVSSPCWPRRCPELPLLVAPAKSVSSSLWRKTVSLKLLASAVISREIGMFMFTRMKAFLIRVDLPLKRLTQNTNRMIESLNVEIFLMIF